MAKDIKINKAVIVQDGVEPYIGTSRTANPIHGGGDGSGVNKFLSLFDNIADGLKDQNIANPTTKVVSVSAATTISDVKSDYVVLVDATSGAITVTLPPAADFEPYKITVKKTDVSANAVTVEGNASETVDGAANTSLASQWDTVTVVSDGSNAFTI